jgi:hypothetical protein
MIAAIAALTAISSANASTAGVPAGPILSTPIPAGTKFSSQGLGQLKATAPGVTPNSLSSGGGNCPSYTFCMWQNSYYNGPLYYYSYPSYPVNSYDYVGSYANDQASSIQNFTSNSVHVYKNYPGDGSGDGCVGTTYRFIPDLSHIGYPQNGSTMNDTISSFDLQTFNTCS